MRLATFHGGNIQASAHLPPCVTLTSPRHQAAVACNYSESSERIESSVGNGSRHGVLMKMSSDLNL